MGAGRSAGCRALIAAAAIGCLPHLAAAQSLLVQAIGPGVDLGRAPPAMQVLGDPLQPQEAGPCPAALANACRFSALDAVFGGADAHARAAFRAAMARYLARDAVRFAGRCGAGAGAAFQLYTYAKPFETEQAAFIARLGHDFLPPGARRTNAYRGDRACPLIGPGGAPDLARRFGSLARFGAEGAVLQTDNRLNPYRWIAPLNAVLHHEQPSLALVAKVTQAGRVQSANLLAAALRGGGGAHLVLDYAIDLAVQDFRAALGEQRYADMMAGADGRDLFSVTERTLDAYCRAAGEASAAAAHLRRYWQTRYLAPSIQLSLAVNFSEDGVYWRDSEFMLASRGYAPSWTGAFRPVGDPGWASFIPEGGNAGKVAWNRLRLDAFAAPHGHDPQGAASPLAGGAAYRAIPPGDAVLHLQGRIDLSAYYRLAMAQRFFPGTSGVFDGVARSSLDAAGRLQADEHHRVNWVGVIYEVHGPFAVRVTIRRLDLRAVAVARTAPAGSG